MAHARTPRRGDGDPNDFRHRARKAMEAERQASLDDYRTLRAELRHVPLPTPAGTRHGMSPESMERLSTLVEAAVALDCSEAAAELQRAGWTQWRWEAWLHATVYGRARTDRSGHADPF